MKNFEGILAVGLATATLATGCGSPKQQSPEVAKSLEKTIEPSAVKMARRAIALSKGESPKFTVYYDDGETSLSRIVDNPAGGFRMIDLTFTGDESQVSLVNLERIQISTAECKETVKNDSDCPVGEEYSIYTPRAKYEGQKAWEALDTGYITLPENDSIPEGFTIDSVNDFATGESAVPTAKDIVKDVSEQFNQIVSAPEF